MSIQLEKCYVGIELGSTRIKAVMINDHHKVVATGAHDWENKLIGGFWTYSLEDIWSGLQHCYQELRADVKKRYGLEITNLGGLGFSGMMHGYLAFSKDEKLLLPFRTWRNSYANEASAKLTKAFNLNIPERWSIAHLYHCITHNDEHVAKVDFFTTLSGYIHWQLTGCRYLGIGDAVGMFPIDPATMDYDTKLLDIFEELVKEYQLPWKLKDLLPIVKVAGDDSGKLTEKGAKLLDPSGSLKAGIPLCPPEGDAGTGMVATNAVKPRTGNVSAGTSIFAMVVLEDRLKRLHRELDMVTTPDGSPVAMVHANNGTSDLNAWVELFGEFAELMGNNLDKNELFSKLYSKALEGDTDAGGLLSYGYLSGEFITGLTEGRPLFVRTAHSKFNLSNFIRCHLYSSMGAIKLGMDILMDDEKVKIDKLLGHGGLFKTKGVAQSLMASAINVPVSVMETAGEGGPWGEAVLVSYMVNRKQGESLVDFLENRIFANNQGVTIEPNQDDIVGYQSFIKRYSEGIAIEKAAVNSFTYNN